jgi:two-component system, chemotaxis family, protein-glutamate methylesterase/glutaminase
MATRNIIVVGASAGGVEALKNFVRSLPKGLKASIFIVLHIPGYSKSFLPSILSKVTFAKVLHPKDGEKIEEGKIYIAPPDHHLLIERGKIAITKGPKENRFRPSIDALFRSAAYVYGPKVIGIVLSGVLNDGTSGLWSIKRLGGIAIVQTPAEASFPEMPLNVMEYVKTDYVLSVTDMGRILSKLCSEPPGKKRSIPPSEMELLKMEVTIATHDNAFEMGIMNKGKLTSFTCPECHGTLIQFTKGKIVEFRCHTGHSFTASALLAGVSEVNEQLLYQAMRGLEEAAMLIETIGKHFEDLGHVEAASIFFEKAKENVKKARKIHSSAFQSEFLSEDIGFRQNEPTK